MRVWSLGWEDPLEENMATHLNILAWKIPWTEEPGGLWSIGSQRVGHAQRNLACTHMSTHLKTEFHNLVYSLTCKTFGIFTSSFSRKIAELNENQQLFLDPSEYWDHRWNHHPEAGETDNHSLPRVKASAIACEEHLKGNWIAAGDEMLTRMRVKSS